MNRPYEFLTPEQMADWDAGMRRKEALREGADEDADEEEFDPDAIEEDGESDES